MKVVNSSLTQDLTSPLMKQESAHIMDTMKHKMMDRLREVPYLFFCILALIAFATIGFVLHIFWKAEASRVQDWFCNGTSRQNRWRAFDALHRECFQEELLHQKPAAKTEAGEFDKTGTTKEC